MPINWRPADTLLFVLLEIHDLTISKTDDSVSGYMVNMSLVVRKPVFGGFDLVAHNLADMQQLIS